MSFTARTLREREVRGVPARHLPPARLHAKHGAPASNPRQATPLPDGLVVFVKRECPTCVLVQPVLNQLAQQTKLTVLTQDDPAFPAGLAPVDDTSLEVSWHNDIETVPTLIRVDGGVEQGRTEGWVRSSGRR